MGGRGIQWRQARNPLCRDASIIKMRLAKTNTLQHQCSNVSVKENYRPVEKIWYTPRGGVERSLNCSLAVLERVFFFSYCAK